MARIVEQMQNELTFLQEENKQKIESVPELFTILRNYQQIKYQNLKEIVNLKMKVLSKRQFAVITQWKHKLS